MWTTVLVKIDNIFHINSMKKVKLYKIEEEGLV